MESDIHQQLVGHQSGTEQIHEEFFGRDDLVPFGPRILIVESSSSAMTGNSAAGIGVGQASAESAARADSDMRHMFGRRTEYRAFCFMMLEVSIVRCRLRASDCQSTVALRNKLEFSLCDLYQPGLPGARV